MLIVIKLPKNIIMDIIKNNALWYTDYNDYVIIIQDAIKEGTLINGSEEEWEKELKSS